MRVACVFPITMYQKVISPFLPQRCRYRPSCSEYNRQAILTHGILRGMLLGVGRILRCWSWFAAGEDPVPETGGTGLLADLLAGYRRFYAGPKVGRRLRRWF